MPVAARCVHCRATLRVPDTLAGKQVKCPKCGKPFRVASEEDAEAPIAARPMPARQKAAAAASRRPVRRDEEAEEDDAPRARRKWHGSKKKKASNQGLIVGLSVGGGVLVLSLIVIVGVVVAKSRTADPAPAPVIAQVQFPALPAEIPLPNKVEPPPSAPQPEPVKVAEVQPVQPTPVAASPAPMPKEPERPKTSPEAPTSPPPTKLEPGVKITVRTQIGGSPPKFQGDFNRHVTQQIEIALRKLGYEPVPDGGLILQVNAQIGPTGKTITVQPFGASAMPRLKGPGKGQPAPQKQTYPLEQVTGSLVLTDPRGSALWKKDSQFRAIQVVFHSDPPGEMRETMWNQFAHWASGDVLADMR